MKHIILYSGGMDSLLLSEKVCKELEYSLDDIIPVCIRYMKHQPEVAAAEKLYKQYPFQMKPLVVLDLTHNFDNPTPLTEITARNLIFILMALLNQEPIDKREKVTLYIAIRAHDSLFTGKRYYNDCSPKFVAAVNDLFEVMDLEWEVIAPFTEFTRQTLLRNSDINDFSNVLFCNSINTANNSGINCGVCPKCITAHSALKEIAEETGREFKVSLERTRTEFKIKHPVGEVV